MSSDTFKIIDNCISDKSIHIYIHAVQTHDSESSITFAGIVYKSKIYYISISMTCRIK